MQLGDLLRRDGHVLQGRLLLLGCAGELTHPPLAGGLAGDPRCRGGLDELERPGVDDVAHLGVAQAPLGLEATTLGRGHLGQPRTDLLDPFAAGRHRNQVRLGEVAIVVGVGLDATGAGGAVGLAVTGLLKHFSPGGQDGGLTLDLVADDLLDPTEGVDVLGLRAGSQRRVGRLAQGDVDVRAHVAALHARLGDAQGPEDVAQGAHVGGGDLRRPGAGALDGSGDDLHQRHAGAVVVHQGVAGALDTAVGTPDVGVLAGVLLHVGPLDRDGEEGAVLHLDLQGAVVGDGLIGLGGLEVLGQVRVEVVLPGEAAGLRDLTSQRQADADGVLHAAGVDHRQRPG